MREASTRNDYRAVSEGSAGSCQMCMYSISYTGFNRHDDDDRLQTAEVPDMQAR